MKEERSSKMDCEAIGKISLIILVAFLMGIVVGVFIYTQSMYKGYGYFKDYDTIRRADILERSEDKVKIRYRIPLGYRIEWIPAKDFYPMPSDTELAQMYKEWKTLRK